MGPFCRTYLTRSACLKIQKSVNQLQMKYALKHYGPIRTRGRTYIFCVTLLKSIFEVSLLDTFYFSTLSTSCCQYLYFHLSTFSKQAVFEGNYGLFLFCFIARRLRNISRLISSAYHAWQMKQDGNRRRGRLEWSLQLSAWIFHVFRGILFTLTLRVHLITFTWLKKLNQHYQNLFFT